MMTHAEEPYSYDLPDARIAQRPAYPPDSAKMLVIDRVSGTLTDSTFRDLPEFLTLGERVVFNDTRVIPARLYGILSPGGASIELLLVRPVAGQDATSGDEWVCIGRPLKRIRRAQRIDVSETLSGYVTDDTSVDTVTVRFESQCETGVAQLLQEHGTMPIPPYIRGGKSDEQDLKDYQTIFAERPGSVAAPTASLHFTEELLSRMKGRGVETSFLTLHVGTASFQPVLVDGVLRPPAREELQVSEALVADVTATRNAGSRVLGVGTTVVRALESAAVGTTAGTTELFITPGFQFRLLDSLITNFHQPGTTHLLLVEAFLGRELLARAYAHALEHGYRFLSYGDGMLIR